MSSQQSLAHSLSTTTLRYAHTRRLRLASEEIDTQSTRTFARHATQDPAAAPAAAPIASTVPPVCAHAVASSPKQQTQRITRSPSLKQQHFGTSRQQQQQSSNRPDQQFNTRDTAKEAPVSAAHQIGQRLHTQVLATSTRKEAAQFQQDRPQLTHIAEQPQKSYSSSTESRTTHTTIKDHLAPVANTTTLRLSSNSSSRITHALTDTELQHMRTKATHVTQQPVAHSAGTTLQ